MKTTAVLLLFLLLLSCSGHEKNRMEISKDSWAIRFADAVMHRSDSLVYYLRDKPKYEYDYAFLAYAIDKLGAVDTKYSEYARAYIDYFVKNNGSISGYKLSDYNIDRVRPGVNILDLYKKTGEQKYLIAAQTLESQMETHPRTESNGYWHKKMYPWQMWLDGLFMAEPFRAEYAAEFNKPEMFDDIVLQFELSYEKTRDSVTGLLYHAWDESRSQLWCNPETGQSKEFWARGTGWYLMAINDVLDYLPEDHPGREKLIAILNQASLALLKVQDPATGLWYQVLDKGGMEGNYPEASGTNMFIYAFAKGANKGYLPESYREIAAAAFDSMISNLVITGDDGYPVLINVCGGAGLGGEPYRMADYAYYIGEKRVDNDTKGIAPLILAAIELDK